MNHRMCQLDSVCFGKKYGQGCQPLGLLYQSAAGAMLPRDGKTAQSLGQGLFSDAERGGKAKTGRNSQSLLPKWSTQAPEGKGWISCPGSVFN